MSQPTLTPRSLVPNRDTFNALLREFTQGELEITFDLSASGMELADLDNLRPKLTKALDAMQALENGAIANTDENRMVGHYWLRAPELAPTLALSDLITRTVNEVERFADDVLSGRVCSAQGSPFESALAIGIGGSALGPQLLIRALGGAGLAVTTLDNTDPDGMEEAFAEFGPEGLATTLVLVTSKSGGTPETLNGMLEAERAYTQAGLSFSQHAVAITGEGSKLFQQALRENWIRIFPMEDWVGGRTSVTSAVGLLPAALAGVDIRAFLKGAGLMDRLTRSPNPHENPAALMAAAWYHLGEGRGSKDMVVLPYKDRLELFSRYLQQLVMESLGKALDRQGNRVEQGLSVYGNKGSTDQHAYVQQLRDGLRNFFVTFITVEKARDGSPFEVAPGVETGDFLNAFFLGTRSALAEEGRASLTISVPELNAFTLGALIAWFERAVGLYAELININAYHQPGVEAGKKAASSSLELQAKILQHLSGSEHLQTVEEIAESLGASSRVDVVYYLCRHLAANGRLVKDGSGTASRFRGVLH